MNQFQNEYARFLKNFLMPQKPLKVVFDCSNGTAGEILKGIFQEKGKSEKVKGIQINQNPDGNFPAHGPNPLKAGAFDDIKKSVLKNNSDLGVIFDADGDRAFFIDDKGRFINPDIIARLLIWGENPDKVVVDVRTGWAVRKLSPFTFHLFTSRVGHYFIKKLMREKNIDFGCEQSGHYYFSFPEFGKGVAYDSGILGALKIINAVSDLPYKISDFVDLLPQYYRSGEINLKVKSKMENGKRLEKEAKELFKKVEGKYKSQAIKISHLDGLSMEFADFWFNIRPSNTELVIRVNVEAANKDVLAKQTKMLLGLLRK